MESLSKLALATKELEQGLSEGVLSLMSYVTQWNTASLLKGRLEERDVEAASQGLDRLAQDEAQMTALDVLKTVHGLVQDINATTDGMKMHSAFHPPVEYRSLQTASHLSRMSRKFSVCFVCDVKLFPCLTDH